MKNLTILLISFWALNNLNAQSFSLGNSTIPMQINNEGLKSIDNSISGAIGQLHNIGTTIPNPLLPAIDSFTDLNIQTLRFPTTDFNLYHFGINKKGYGFNYDEVYWNKKSIDGTSSSDRAQKTQNLISKDESYSANIIELFIETVHQTEENNNCTVNVIYTLNIWQHFRNTGGNFNFHYDLSGRDVITSGLTSLSILPGNPLFNSMMQENIDAIQYLKNNGVNVVGVEYDNEPYDWPLISNQDTFKLNQTKINNYISVIQTYDSMIKSIWPNMKSSIPFAHYGGPNGNLYNSSVWSKNFYDAFSIHHYSNPQSTNKLFGIDCIKIDLPPNAPFSQILDFINNDINGTGNNANCGKQLSSRLSTLDSKNKEYWILEWNTSDKININNSILHAEYYYKMLFSEFIPNNRIKNCIYWAASMVDNGPVFNQSYPHWGGMMRHKITNANDWFINKQATYYPALYFNKIFKDNMKLIDNYNWNNWSDFGQIPSFIRTNFNSLNKNKFFIRPFIKTLTNPLTHIINMYIYFSNMSSETVTVDYSNFYINTPFYSCSGNQGATNYTFKATPGGIVENYYDVATINYIKTNSTNWGIGQEPERWFNYSFTSKQHQGWYDFDSSNIIPPYSVGMINLTLSTSECNGSTSIINKAIDKQEKNIYNKFLLYPNPTKEIINFEFSDNGTKKIEIYDIQGKVIKNIITNDNSYYLNMSGCSKGVYIYTILYEDGKIEKSKFILE